MKVMIDDSRIKELIRYILQKDFDIYNIDEINKIEEEVLNSFDEKVVVNFIYGYINELLKYYI